MIGSPWNPFFEQSHPGTITRYDSRRTDNADGRQHGAYNLKSLPQYLQLFDTEPWAVDWGDDIILTRQYDLLSTGSSVIVDLGGAKVIVNGDGAEAFAIAFGDQWGKKVTSDILKTGYLWWYHPVLTFNSMLPRVLYKSEPLDSDQNRWWFAAGIHHPDRSYNQISAPLFPEQDWPLVWSAWYRNDGPPSIGGRAAQTEDDFYPLYFRECQRDNDVDGSRLISPFDLNRPFHLPWFKEPTEDEAVPPAVRLQPWYYH